jgi:hypothetical protein
MASQLAVKLKELSYFRALGHTLKFVNLKNVKSVKFRFNPFEENVASVRYYRFSYVSDSRRCMPVTLPVFVYEVDEDFV